MTKNYNNQSKKNKKAQSNADVELAGEKGLEKVARMAQKKPK